MAEQLSSHGEHVYFIVVDTGNVRQMMVQCHSPKPFEDWQSEVQASINAKGFYPARVHMQNGQVRNTMVIGKGACTLAFMTREDVETAQRMAQMAQGGQIVAAR